MSHPSGVLNSNESLYRGNEFLEGPFEDISLVEDYLCGEGASIERGGSGEDGGDSIGEEPQAKEEAPVSWKKGQVRTSQARSEFSWNRYSKSQM